MNQNSITRINGTEIVTVDREGESFVPIKPICDALGIDAKVQRRKLQDDEFFSSTGVIMTSVGADNCTREMFALPLKYIYGWLATINPGKVAPEAREAVSKYRRECYEVLYEHFQLKARKATEQAQAEARLLQRKLEQEQAMKECRAEMKKIDADLAKLQEERLNPQPTLF